MQENEKYLDSVSGKMQKMQNHLEEMANIVANSDGLKVILDLVNGILSGATKLLDVFGGLNGVVGAIAAFGLQKGGLGLFGFDKNNGFSTIFDSFRSNAKKTMV